LAVKAAKIVETRDYAALRLTADYAQLARITTLIKKADGLIKSEAFADSVEITAELPLENAQIVQEELRLFVKNAEIL